jgi:integrase
VLHVCLADAERLGMIAANPLRHVRAPSAPPVPRRAWTPEQARRFLAVAESGEDRTMWLLMLTCGLRIGEILALAWGDCDLERGLLHVRRTMTTDRVGKAKIGDTTKGGKPRTMPLAPSVVDALRAHRARVLALRLAYADVWQDLDLVFPNGAGVPRNDRSTRERLRAMCVEADVPMLTPHGLRHTAASLLAEHAPVAVARDVLGHSSLAITNQYVHASDQAKQAGAEALGRLLAGS